MISYLRCSVYFFLFTRAVDCVWLFINNCAVKSEFLLLNIVVVKLW